MGRKKKVEDIFIDNNDLNIDINDEHIIFKEDIFKDIDDKVLSSTMLSYLDKYSLDEVIVCLQRVLRIVITRRLDSRTIITCNLHSGINPRFIEEINLLK